jgi:glycosyltransferase involved in cell wall biosynthesis
MLRDADIFAFPTFYPNEAFPLVLLEAMAAGLPVISTTVGGIPDMVIDGETGLLVPPGEVSSLASALRRLVTDSGLRIRMGQAGRGRFMRHYTLEQYEANLSDLLDHYLVNETQP